MDLQTSSWRVSGSQFSTGGVDVHITRYYRRLCSSPLLVARHVASGNSKGDSAPPEAQIWLFLPPHRIVCCVPTNIATSNKESGASIVREVLQTEDTDGLVYQMIFSYEQRTFQRYDSDKSVDDLFVAGVTRAVPNLSFNKQDSR